MYVGRGLEGRLIDAVAATPVVVLEGARAVGKSRMCDELVQRGHLAIRSSLSDPLVRELAQRDLRGWLESLRTPAVIDEAQLIPDLPLAVKDFVDLRAAPAQFVLTGSASIGRTGLGGSDPLAGRVVRLRLRPLAQLELRDRGSVGDDAEMWSVVDSLFDHLPRVGDSATPVDRESLARRMSLGGFPLRVVGSGAAPGVRLHRELVEADIEAALAEVRIGDERLDVFRARKLLDSVAGVPGGILNVSKLAGELGMARQTVETYLGHLQRRFLVHRLVNLGARPRAQGVGTARPKVHPVDTALSIAILDRMGQRFRSNAELFGALLESYVVNELIAQASWSEIQPDSGYWRDTGRHGDAEVDLVLVDGSGRWVGVEVKSSGSVRLRDADGLLALRAARGLHRGFVVYQGTEIVEIADSIWAVPLAALTESKVWEMPRKPLPTRVAEGSESVTADIVSTASARVSPPVATMFVTYVHADDEYENGAIRRIASRLAETYEFLFGDELEVFIDRDIRWGELWEARIATELERTAFLLAVVTPRFLTSTRCREEVIQFAGAARRLGQPRLVLPLIWRMPPQLETPESDDPVVIRLREAEWVEIGDLRHEDPSSASYRRQLEALAERLHGTVTAMDAGPVQPTSSARRDPDGPGLDELTERAEIAAQSVGLGFEELAAAIQQVGTDLGKLTLQATGGPVSARSARAWATRAGEVMAPSAAGLQRTVAELGPRWSELDQAVTGILRLVDEFPSERRPTSLVDLVGQIEDLHDGFDQVLGSPELIELGSMLRGVAAASRRLRPLARAVESALALVGEMRTSTATWLRMRDALPPNRAF